AVWRRPDLARLAATNWGGLSPSTSSSTGRCGSAPASGAGGGPPPREKVYFQHLLMPSAKLITTPGRKARAARGFLAGLLDTAPRLLVQIIPSRRCNIDWGYGNEYDRVSPPVPTEVRKRRIDKLAELGTSVVAFSGGEPMLHPDLNDLIRHIRAHGMMAGL